MMVEWDQIVTRAGFLAVSPQFMSGLFKRILRFQRPSGFSHKLSPDCNNS